MEPMTQSSPDQPRKQGFGRLRYWLAGVSLVGIGLVAGWQLSGTPTWSAAVDTPPGVSAPTGAQERTIGGTQDSYAPIVEKVGPAVVRIEMRGQAKQERTQMQDLPPFFRDFFGPDSQRRRPPQRGIGSGVIVDGNGYIITNNHVVEDADRITVTLEDGRELAGKLVGSDPPTDVAVVKIEEKGLPTLAFADSDAAREGDVVLAVGYPFGVFGRSVTMGIISGKGRSTQRGADTGYEDFLQTDAPINTGNSGGALINTRGELVGIPTQIWSPTGGNIGIGFAIPSNMARSVMDQLLKTGKVTRSQLGVLVQQPDADVVAALNLPSNQGVVVQEVQPDSPAERAGLRQYDFIVQLDGKKIQDSNELRNLVASQPPGRKSKVTFVRDGKEQTATVTLEERKAEADTSRGPEGRDESERGRLGISVEPLTPELRSQLQATRDTGVVIASVDPEGPAAEAGLQRGIIIYEVNQQPVSSAEELSKAAASAGSKPLLLLVGAEGSERILTVRPRG